MMTCNEGNIYFQRIEAVRKIMRTKGLDAVVISGSDPHASEYPALRWKQVEWISGFTGEAGDIVITLDHAGLWTDTRYFIQAVEQLQGTGVELHKTRIPGEVRIPEWLAEVAFVDKRGPVIVALDGLSWNVSSVEMIKTAFKRAGRRHDESAELENGYKIVDMPDMLDQLWDDRPAVPVSPVITLGDDLTGESRQSKIASIRRFLEEVDCDSILFTALDEIAWTLNVRGSDVEDNPVVISYLLVTNDDVCWFVKKPVVGKLDSETLSSFAELEADGVMIRPYDDVELVFSGADCTELRHLYVDPATLNWHLYKAMASSSVKVKAGVSPIPLRKAVKNEIEISGMREAHLEDGLAMEKFLFWLETEMASGAEIDEWDAAVNSFFSLTKINQQLTARNLYLEQTVRKLTAYHRAAGDSTRLQKAQTALLNEFKLIPAKVITNSLDKPDNFITLDKGRADGVEEDMGVACGNGIVGVVYMVSDHYSIVIPVLNSQSNISVKIRKRGYYGYLKWDGGAADKAFMTDVPRHAHFRIGDIIETSGYSAIFPPGIVVGQVLHVYNSSDGLSYKVQVHLSTDFGNLRDVCIIDNSVMKERMQLLNAAQDSLKLKQN